MPIVTGSKMVKVCIDPDMYERLETLSKERGNKSFSSLIVSILNKELSSTEKKVTEKSVIVGNNRPF